MSHQSIDCPHCKKTNEITISDFTIEFPTAKAFYVCSDCANTIYVTLDNNKILLAEVDNENN